MHMRSPINFVSVIYFSLVCGHPEKGKLLFALKKLFSLILLPIWLSVNSVLRTLQTTHIMAISEKDTVIGLQV